MSVKSEGALRFMQLNFDAFGESEHSRQQQTDMWQTVHDLGVDVMGGQDHRYGELGATILASRARAWDGPHTWVAAEGMKRPNGQLKRMKY